MVCLSLQVQLTDLFHGQVSISTFVDMFFFTSSTIKRNPYIVPIHVFMINQEVLMNPINLQSYPELGNLLEGE